MRHVLPSHPLGVALMARDSPTSAAPATATLTMHGRANTEVLVLHRVSKRPALRPSVTLAAASLCFLAQEAKDVTGTPTPGFGFYAAANPFAALTGGAGGSKPATGGFGAAGGGGFGGFAASTPTSGFGTGGGGFGGFAAAAASGGGFGASTAGDTPAGE